MPFPILGIERLVNEGAIDFSPTSVIAIAGAGGKTSLLFALAKALPFPTFLTTTTRVGQSQIQEADVCRSLSDLSAEISEKVCWVSPDLAPLYGKIRGFGAHEFPELIQAAAALGRAILYEADGSKQLPIKAPNETEPVIPRGTNLFFYVTGLSALGTPIDNAHTHRPEIFCHVNQLKDGGLITEEIIAKNILNPQSGMKGCPQNAQRVAVLNQADTLELIYAAERVKSYLQAQDSNLHVWITKLK